MRARQMSLPRNTTKWNKCVYKKTVPLFAETVFFMYYRYMISKGENIHAITNSTEAGKYLVPRLMFEKEERALLLCLDAKKHILACVDLGGGVVNAIEINVRKVVEIAVRNRASSVVLAHNHPDGIALPSREDENATAKIASALRLIEITLDDHIIVAGEDYVSFRDSGMMGLYIR